MYYHFLIYDFNTFAITNADFDASTNFGIIDDTSVYLCIWVVYASSEVSWAGTVITVWCQDCFAVIGSLLKQSI